MIIKLLTEFVGTFIFLSVIIATGEAIPIALTLAAMILFGGKISGGHFNPAVSTMFLVKGDIDMVTYMAYIMVQVLAGISAYYFLKNKYFIKY